MIWISDSVAVLQCDQEICQHYKLYRPVHDQFSLQNPYQSHILGAHASKALESATQIPEDHPQGLIYADTGDTTTASASEVFTNKKRKSRRGTSLPTSETFRTRQGEANQRHAKYEQLLLDAYQVFNEWMQRKEHTSGPHQIESSQNRPSQPAGQPHGHLQRSAAEAEMSVPAVAAEEGADSFDLVALSELRHVLKPKLQYDSCAAQPLDLFNTMIENADNVERLATAFTARVLIPRHSRFLISDVNRMQPLVAGDRDPLSNCSRSAVYSSLTNILGLQHRACMHDTPRIMVCTQGCQSISLSKLHYGSVLGSGSPGSGYDCIVMDPPWENKSAKRSATYPTLPSRRLLSIPMARLLEKVKTGVFVHALLTIKAPACVLLEAQRAAPVYWQSCPVCPGASSLGSAIFYLFNPFLNFTV